MGLFKWVATLFKGSEADSVTQHAAPPQRVVPPASTASPDLAREPRFVVLDVETTGLSPKRDRVLEIALVTVGASGGVLDEWSTRLNPQGPVGATHIHGITESDVARAPLFRDVVQDVALRLRGAAVVAHNANFDLAFLRTEFGRSGWSMPFVPALCTLEASAYYLPHLPRRRLADCCQAAGVRLHHAHSALGDARATAALLHHYFRADVNPRPRVEDLHLPSRASAIVWPNGPQSAPTAPANRKAPANRRVVRASAPTPSAPLVQLVSRFSLEGALEEGAHTSSLAYLEKLAEVLADGVITVDEAEDLQELAGIHGLAESDVAATNRAFVLALAHEAMADGKVSRAERDELVRLTTALGLEAKLVTRMIAKAEEARNLRLGAKLAPLPAGWDLGEPLRVGDRVVFTGGDESVRARLETASESAGVRVLSAVSGRTTMLVTDGQFQGTKDARAQELGTRRVTPAQYELLLRHLQPAIVKGSKQ